MTRLERERDFGYGHGERVDQLAINLEELTRYKREAIAARLAGDIILASRCEQNANTIVRFGLAEKEAN